MMGPAWAVSFCAAWRRKFLGALVVALVGVGLGGGQDRGEHGGVGESGPREFGAGAALFHKGGTRRPGTTR
ncbi:MAG TPA: hypothetical protein VH478_15055 [Trebonia sp.]|nr:hypothetical protein [Trebonia sp.]